jgi:hypothetical protein
LSTSENLDAVQTKLFRAAHQDDHRICDFLVFVVGIITATDITALLLGLRFPRTNCLRRSCPVYHAGAHISASRVSLLTDLRAVDLLEVIVAYGFHPPAMLVKDIDRDVVIGITPDLRGDLHSFPLSSGDVGEMLSLRIRYAMGAVADVKVKCGHPEMSK